jgi:hypothetical protein
MCGWVRFRRQLTEDVNVEISDRDLGRVPDEGAADRLPIIHFVQRPRSAPWLLWGDSARSHGATRAAANAPARIVPQRYLWR